MAAIAFIAFWVVLALGLLITAMGGGPKHAREHVLHAEGRAGRRAGTLVLSLIIVAFGVAVPTYVIAANNEDDEAGTYGIKLSGGEKEGRELFGTKCNQCHVLAAANSVGRTGPNLDNLRPPKALVLDAIANGRSKGIGRMPQQLVSGDEAEDVAAFVAKVAGRG